MRLILRPVGRYDTPGEALKVAVAEDYAYIADGPGGLRIIDVSDPSAPAEVAAYQLASSHTRDVVVIGAYVYTADGPEGLQVIDVSDPKQSVAASWYDTSEEAHDLAVAGATALVISAPQHRWSGNLELFDLTEPAGSGPVSTYRSSFDSIFRVAIDGVYAYVVGMEFGCSPGSGCRCCYHCECSFLDVVDINDPTAPTRVSDILLN